MRCQQQAALIASAPSPLAVTCNMLAFVSACLCSSCAFCSNEISRDVPPSYSESRVNVGPPYKQVPVATVKYQTWFMLLANTSTMHREEGRLGLLFETLLLPLKIKCITLLWQLHPPVMQRLTPSKSKSLDYEANYFVVVSRTHLLFELGCLEGKK